MNDLLLPAVQKSTGPDLDPYYNLVSLHLKGDVNTGRNYNAFSDASSNNFRLTNNGDVRGSSFSPYGTSWSGFFGGGYITVPSGSAVTPTGTQSYCLEFFAYITGFSGTYDIFVEGSTNTNGFQIAYFNDGGANQGRLGVSASGVGAIAVASATAYLNKWVHVVATRSGNDHRLFFDGVLVAYASNAISFGARGTQAFGAQAAGSLPIDGYMSNIRVCLDAIPTSYQTSSTTVGTSVFSAVTSPLTTSSQGASSVALIACHANRFIDRDSGVGTVALTLNGTLRISSFSPFLETDTTTGSGYFDGTGDFLRVPNDTSLQLGNANWAIECWVYLTSASGTQRVISQSDGNYEFAFYLASGALTAYSFQSGGTQNFAVSMGTLVVGQWYHIAATRSGSTIRTFVNGAQVGSTTFAGTIDARTGGWNIGASYTPSEYLFGYVADTRIVKGAAVYTGAFTPPTKSLATSGASSAASYPSTTNIDTTFAASATSLLTLQERGAYNTIGFQDESEYQHVITRNGNVAQGTFSPFSNAGWSNYFDGSGDYLYIDPASALNLQGGAFTIEFWAFRNSGGALQTLLSNYQSSAAGYGISVNASNKLTANLSGDVADITGTTDVPINQWFHVALSGTPSSSIKLFLNGVQESSTYTGATSLDSTRRTAIGAFWYFFDGNLYDPLPGYISNLRILKGAALYTANFTPPTEPLTAISGTSLLTCQSNRFVDNSASPLTIIRIGDTRITPFSPFKPVAYDPAVHGGSGYFDGTTDNLAVVSPQFTLGTDNLTAECWFYPTAAGNSSTILACKISAGAGFYLIWSSTSAFRVLVNAGTNWNVDASSAALNLNTWNHLVMTRDGSTIRTFLNGVLATVTTGITGSMGATAPIVRIGSDDAGSGVVNASYITGVRIVKGVVYPTSLTTTGTQVFTPPNQPAPVINNTLFLLNFTNGGVIDSTGKNVLETVGNAGVVTTTIKKYGSGSLFFDGTGDWFFDQSPIPPTTFGSGDFSIEMWFYTTTTGVQRWLIDGRIATPADGAYPAIYITSGNNLVYYVSAAARITGATAIAANTWYFLQVIRYSGVTKMYLNGSQEGANYPDATVYANPGVGRPAIGVATNLVQPFFGHIDDLRITNGYARLPTTPSKAFPDRGTASTLTVDMAAPSSVEALVVGGGGGGGAATIGGPGGGGGIVYDAAVAVSAGSSYPISVGIGGTGNGGNGANSVGFSYTADGGGAGGYWGSATTRNAKNGGSGGAAGEYAGIGTPGTSTQNTYGGKGFGNSGGAGYASGSTIKTGGGGGAGGAGSAATSTAAGNGGAGKKYSITGIEVGYGGGGGGTDYNASNHGTATDGGGAGSPTGTAGTPNTGGGGGASHSGSGTSGGSGVVILAYPTSFRPLKASLGLVYTIDTVTRPGYRVYRFTSGSGSISW